MPMPILMPMPKPMHLLLGDRTCSSNNRCPYVPLPAAASTVAADADIDAAAAAAAEK